MSGRIKYVWRKTRKVLPWAGSALLLAYVAGTTNWSTVWDSLSSVSVPLFILISVLGTLSTYAFDTLGVSLVFSTFVTPVSFRQALPIKATSYFLNVLNYNAALAGMAWYLQRSRQASFWKALGALFTLNLVDLFVLCLWLGVSTLWTLGDQRLDGSLAPVAAPMALGGVLGFPILVLAVRRSVNWPIIGRIARWQIVAPLRELTIQSFLHLVLVRVGLLACYMGVQVAYLYLFGIQVPFALQFFYFPLLTFVQIIPISISGLGTIQLLVRHLYSPFVPATLGSPDGVVDAYSTSGILAALGLRLLVAWVFLGEFSREVMAKARTSDMESGPVEDLKPE